MATQAVANIDYTSPPGKRKSRIRLVRNPESSLLYFARSWWFVIDIEKFVVEQDFLSIAINNCRRQVEIGFSFQ